MVDHTAFFYGTLIHPKILKRVIGNDGAHLRVASAVLLEHTRHKVQYADYPGVLPVAQGQSLHDHELIGEERAVRGVIVTGLTDGDVLLLDIFEGNEYSRQKVSIHPLAPFSPLPSLTSSALSTLLVPTHPPPLPPLSKLPPPFQGETYIWIDHPDRLEKKLWDFEEFVRDSAWKWHGKGADTNEEFSEVDRRNERSTAHRDMVE